MLSRYSIQNIKMTMMVDSSKIKYHRHNDLAITINDAAAVVARSKILRK